MSCVDLADTARWNEVPDASDLDAVLRFAMSYNGYVTHGQTPDQLTRALGHVLGRDWDRDIDITAATDDLRAALFAMGRAAHMAGDVLDPLPPSWEAVLRELRKRREGPFLAVERPGYSEGFSPASYEVADRLVKRPVDLVLLAALLLPQHVDPDWLAWLALTSKPELAVRDQLGWLLQRGVAPSGYVSREWNRSDLALLVDEKPRLLVEGKAMYGFDALNPRTREKYVNLVAADLAKARRLDGDADVVATVLVSSPQTPWSPEYSGAVAYRGQNAAFAASGEEAGGRAVEEMWEALRTLGAVATIDLGTGEAFDGAVNTTMFVVRPHNPVPRLGPSAPRGSLRTDPPQEAPDRVAGLPNRHTEPPPRPRR